MRKTIIAFRILLYNVLHGTFFFAVENGFHFNSSAVLNAHPIFLFSFSFRSVRAKFEIFSLDVPQALDLFHECAK